MLKVIDLWIFFEVGFLNMIFFEINFLKSCFSLNFGGSRLILRLYEFWKIVGLLCDLKKNMIRFCMGLVVLRLKCVSLLNW